VACPDLVDRVHVQDEMLFNKLLRAEIAEGGMQALTIVPNFNVYEDHGANLSATTLFGI